MSNPTIYGNLGNQYPNIANLTDKSLVNGNADLSALNTNTQALQSNLNTINTNSDATLSRQSEVKQILDNESNRLNDKKQNVDNAYSSQQRAVFMNHNLQKRYNAYVQILYVIVIVLFVIFVISMVQSYFPIIPTFIFNLVYIGLISFLILYSIVSYYEIQRHDKMEYDKLKLIGRDATNSDISGADISDGLFIGGYGVCINGSCCAEGTQWDASSGTCIPTTSQETFSCMSGLQPFGPYEYSTYSRY
jgi:hypothetical protein